MTSENRNQGVADATGNAGYSGFCVIIPTYNNATTLGTVIEDVAGYTRDIIVVDDGSTDQTKAILNAYPFLKTISYPINEGKGMALRKGFDFARTLGYQYAITIDSDGQHFAKDIPVFIEKIKTTGAALLVGARNMNQESVPGGSSFGNRFSNFWFKAETGIRLPDTQSGYRLYPLLLLNQMRFFTRKYEFEIEVLVRAAWKGIKVLPVPVNVYYAPKAIRVSHFRPYVDFFRISVLNTVLVLIAFLYIKPRDFLRRLFTKNNFKKELIEQLFHPHQSAELKAASIGVGVFMGIIPIWGFQLAAALLLALLLRLNKILVMIAANISIPPMIPLIIFASYKTGAIWVGDKATSFEYSNTISLAVIQQNLRQYIFGSITLAIVAGSFFWILTLIILKLFNKNYQVPGE